MNIVMIDGRYVAEGIVEAAWLTVSELSDDGEKTEKYCADWIADYEKEVNDRLPYDVWLDLETHKQCGGDTHFLNDDKFSELTHEVEELVDSKWNSVKEN